MKIKRNSLTHKIARFGGMWENEQNLSICELNQYLFFGFFGGLCIFIFGTILLVLLLIPFYYGILHMVDNTFVAFLDSKTEQGHRFFGGLILDSIAIILYTFCRYMQYRQENYEYIAKKIKEPSKMDLHWQALKHKICVKVQIED